MVYTDQSARNVSYAFMFVTAVFGIVAILMLYLWVYYNFEEMTERLMWWSFFSVIGFVVFFGIWYGIIHDRAQDTARVRRYRR